MQLVIRTAFVGALFGLVLINDWIARAIFDRFRCTFAKKTICAKNIPYSLITGMVQYYIAGETFRVRKMLVVEIKFIDFRLKEPCGVANNLRCDVLPGLNYLKYPFMDNFFRHVVSALRTGIRSMQLSEAKVFFRRFGHIKGYCAGNLSLLFLQLICQYCKSCTACSVYKATATRTSTSHLVSNFHFSLPSCLVFFKQDLLISQTQLETEPTRVQTVLKLVRYMRLQIEVLRSISNQGVPNFTFRNLINVTVNG